MRGGKIHRHEAFHILLAGRYLKDLGDKGESVRKWHRKIEKETIVDVTSAYSGRTKCFSHCGVFLSLGEESGPVGNVRLQDMWSREYERLVHSSRRQEACLLGFFSFTFGWSRTFVDTTDVE